jgi:hypothetical protein
MLGYRTVVPGVTKAWMTPHAAEICARRRLAFARHELDLSPENLQRFHAAHELSRVTCRAVQRERKHQQDITAQAHWRTAPGSRAAWKKGSAYRKSKRGASRPGPPLQHFDNLLLSACRLACGVRGFRGEAVWTRRACVSPAFLWALYQVLRSESACNLAHLRCFARLQAASQRPTPPTACVSCRCSCCAAPRTSLAQASQLRLSASASVAPVSPISERLPLLSCALAGVGCLAVRPCSLPCCRQRLCLRPSVVLRPSLASEPSPLLSFHALPPLCRSFSFLLRLCTPSFVSSRATFRSVTLCLGTPCRCMGSVLVLTARFASPGHLPILLGGTSLWNAAGAASSISSSAANLPHLRARILLICGLISWISCHVALSRPCTCARRCMLTLLTLRMFAAFACRGSWILSVSCHLVPALFLLLCARFLTAVSF